MVGAVLLWWVLAGCGGRCEPAGGADSCPPDDDAVGERGAGGLDCDADWKDWANTGQPLMLTWCTACHGAAVTGDRREGAPEGVDFDTLAGVRAHADRIDARLARGDMPPAGGVPGDDVARLRAWLACGAPGEASPLPDFGPLDDGGAEALEVVAETEVDPDDPALLRLRRRIDGAPADAAWRIERYLVSDTDAWLVEVIDLDEDGEILGSMDFQGGLPLLPATDAWEGRLEVTRWTGGVAQTVEEDWSVVVAPAAEVDVMELDPDVTEVIASSSGGDELGWHLSADRGVVAAWAIMAAGRGWQGLQIEAVMPSLPSDAPAFPLDPDWDFVERLIVEEAP